MVEVADHLLTFVLVQPQLTRRQRLRQRVTQQRQAEPPAVVVPIDVEPVGGGGRRTVAQDPPQRAVEVLRRDQGHVVGHHVDDDPEPVRVGGVGEPHQPPLPAELDRDLLVVDHVVPVLGAGSRLQHR